MKGPDTNELARLAPPREAPLSELQEWMALVVRHPRRLTKSANMKDAASQHFSGNDRLHPCEQIDIYRQQFWLRHTSALVEDFPGLTGLLGQSAWEPIVERYLESKENDSLALKELGRGMAAHISSLEEDLIEAKGYDRTLLVEMARLECAYMRAFDLREEPPLSPDKLAKIPADAWQNARFELSNTLSLFHFEYPVASLRRALRATKSAAVEHDVRRDPHYLVVYRRERTLWDKRVSQAAFLLLQQFSRGVPLVPACEAVVTQYPEAERVLEQQLTEWFTLWGRLGWIVDVRAER